MENHTNICVFCDKEKENQNIIEGINGNICKDCLAVIQSVQDTETNDEVNNSKNRINNMSELKKEVDKYVIGQDEAKKQLIVELYKHYGSINSETNNMFLVGDSGVGKTYLVRTLARILKVPFLEVDITEFSETGYKGKDVTEILDELIVQQNGNKENIENSIIFIDEVDKMTTTTASDTPNNKIQHSLLKIIEGMDYHYNIPDGMSVLSGTIDTSKIMFIAAGACVGLNNIREGRLSPKRAIGFGESHDVINEIINSTGEYVGEDLIEFGFIPEFVGRFPLVLELHPLSKENIVEILTNHPNSRLGQAKEIFKKEGIDLIISSDDINWLAEEATKHPLGVRSISHVLTRTLNNQLFDSVLEGKTSIHLRDAFKIPVVVRSKDAINSL